MLRAAILFFLPNIMTAYLQETYMEPMRSNPAAYNGKLAYNYGYPTFQKLPVIPVGPVAYTDQPFKQTFQINLAKKPKLPVNELLKPGEPKIKKPFFINTAYAYNKAGNEKTKNKDFLNYPKLPFAGESVQELGKEDLPPNDGSKSLDEDMLVAGVSDEDILPNKNDIPNLFNINLTETFTETVNELISEDTFTEIPKNKVVNEHSLLTNNSPKLYDENLPVSTEKPKPNEINDDTFTPSTIPTPFYNKLTLPTELPINEDPFLPHHLQKTHDSQLPALTEKNKKQKAFYEQLPPVFTETPDSKKVSNHLAKFPIITETLDEDDFSYDNPFSFYKSKLPVLSDKSLKDWDNARKDKLIKVKLLSLILSTKKDLDKEIDNIRPIHNTFKSGTMYKIGYLISLINKMNRRLRKLYASIQSNVHSWDTLRMLDSYEKMKSDSEVVSDMVKLMRAFLRVKRNTFRLQGVKDPGGRLRPNAGISWSYYDDSLS